jgi:hypothetical protein
LADEKQQPTYTITIGGSWSLKDFYELPHTFAQVYAFHCAFLLMDEVDDPERLWYVFGSFPWRGGYSAVNFYNSLNSQVPRDFRPKVKSIQYASPGWIELSLLVPAAVAVSKVVDMFVRSASGLNGLYTEIYKGMHERNLMRIEAKRQEIDLSEKQIEFAVKMSKLLAEGLGFNRIEELNERTGHPVATLKMLLSYFRRVRKLAEYATTGKAEFPDEQDLPELPE